ncbi:NAD(P)-binding protein [Mytilinidion resinicola]|uniref:NAD(P)-binding protein n=1 Tax=Mytilinidion resinicola TaxID=574789 RepID=A0A6A6YJP2_9PEZI|nr:NAD(P)-binding protein [Mytilinidion resinicola]KAF2809031.1 NAD(P)-binding protein [Mytilinidion resinicola]
MFLRTSHFKYPVDFKNPLKYSSHRENVGSMRFREFDLAGGVYIVTGGARGLGLCLAEALVEAGGKVHCLDLLAEPDETWAAAQSRILPEFGGSLHYHRVDVTNEKELDEVFTSIAEDRKRLDGLIAAAGKQMAQNSVDHKIEDVQYLMDINYTGVFLSASAAARQMIRFKTRGSICLIASTVG